MTLEFRLPQTVTLVFAIVALASALCHRQVAVPELPYRPVTVTDKFFDVWPTGPDRAFIVGARGKVLLTEDDGRHFKPIDIGTHAAVFAIQMVDDENGYLSGQDGLAMRTRDGGKTWERLNTRTRLYIFALSFPDRLHGFMVGERGLVLSTTDGGESFLKRKLEHIFPPELTDYALPFAEPHYYGVTFLDSNHGWVVGELGRIWTTDNGGKTWQEQQDEMLPQWKRELLSNEDPRFLNFTLPNFLGVSFRDPQHGAACGVNGTIVQTSDGGKSWAFAHQADKPDGPPDTLVPGRVPRDATGRVELPAREPLFSIDLYGKDSGVTTGMSGTALRLQGNEAWGPIAGFPPIPLPLMQARFFDDKHGWIVGFGVILYTEDGGKTWRFCTGQG
jgi:photosystem II stability/assembly factor-like uncharacterized protein